jgi:hypothetical protein
VIGGVVAAAGLVGVFLNRPKLVKAEGDTSSASYRPRLLVAPVLGSYTGMALMLCY